jgi:hypothetical protein
MNFNYGAQVHYLSGSTNCFFKGGEDPLADAQLIHANGFEIVSPRLFDIDFSNHLVFVARLSSSTIFVDVRPGQIIRSFRTSNWRATGAKLTVTDNSCFSASAILAVWLFIVRLRTQPGLPRLTKSCQVDKCKSRCSVGPAPDALYFVCWRTEATCWRATVCQFPAAAKAD